jgi:hypothetical protein
MSDLFDLDAEFMAAIWENGMHSLSHRTVGSDKFKTDRAYDLPGSLLQKAKEYGQTACVWVGALPLATELEGGRGKKGDVSRSLRWLFADLDWKHQDAHADSNKLPTEVVVRAVTESFKPMPTYVIDSGHGLQVWWRLDRAVDHDEWDATAKRLKSMLVSAGIASPDRVTDRASVLRVPGTWNMKPNCEPVKVTVLESTGATHSPESFVQAAPEPTAERERKSPPAATGHASPPSKPAEESPADFYRRGGDGVTLSALLERHQFIIGDNLGVEGIDVTRPGKNGGTSGRIHTGTDGSHFLNLFTPNGPAALYLVGKPGAGDPVYRSLSKWDVFVALEHGGDSRAAGQSVRELMNGHQVQSKTAVESEAAGSMIVDGATFLFESDEEVAVRWGSGDDVLWAQGEPFMLAGPPGVGKTTLAHQVTTALIGIRPDVLGYPVAEAKRVLYLAMDRPRQIRRAMRRLVGPQHADVLRERLAVLPRPLPADLTAVPDLIVEMAKKNGCDVVIIDSLKDAATELSDDKVGGSVNRALQLCVADHIDVMVLHHMRKAGSGNAKPNKLADVYGSAWLTAGVGSCIVLWGEAGDPIVDLLHLKQPMNAVGPFKVEHDHEAGISSIPDRFDVLAAVMSSGVKGLTIPVLAAKAYGSTEPKLLKRMERQLKKLVKDEHAEKVDGGNNEDGTRRAAAYRQKGIGGESSTDTSTDIPLSAPSTDTPADKPRTATDTFRKTPGQDHGHTTDNLNPASTTDISTLPLGVEVSVDHLSEVSDAA